jgi:hypothetical protein
VINYARTTAYQYKAYAYDCIASPAPSPTGTIVELNFDNLEYQANWEKLLARFFAFNEPAPVVPPGDPAIGPSAAYARNAAVSPSVRNTELNGRLSLLPVKIDATSPAGNLNNQFRTELIFEIFNENENGFTGTQKCICCWDSALFENYGAGALRGVVSSPENFRAETLMTDFGYAIIDAPGPAIIGSDNCQRPADNDNIGPDDPGSGPSVAAPLVGIQTTVSRWGSESFSEDGAELTGVGAADTTGFITHRVSNALAQDEEDQGSDNSDGAPVPTPTKANSKKK